jgi:hypothetical protein
VQQVLRAVAGSLPPSTVPPAQSRQVADAAGQLHRLVEVPGVDHDDALLLDGDLLVDAVVELAARTAGE